MKARTTLRLTAMATETMPVPYGARPGLEEVEEGSVSLVGYTSRYVNETGLTLVLSKDKLGRYTDAGKMLGKGGSYGEHSFQGDGRISHGPTFYFLENAYQMKQALSRCAALVPERDRFEAGFMEAVRGMINQWTLTGSGGLNTMSGSMTTTGSTMP